MNAQTAPQFHVPAGAPGKFFEQPSVALYYAVVLQATGHAKRARKYFDIAAGIELPPEERKPLLRARSKS